MGHRFALMASPLLLAKDAFFFAMFGLWLLLGAGLVERTGDYESRLSRRIRRRLLAGNWLLYLRLGGTCLLLAGSMALLTLVGRLTWPANATAPWIVMTSTGPQPVPTAPNLPSDAPRYDGMVLVLTGGALLLFGSRYRRFVPALAGSAMLLMGITPTIKNEFKFDNHFKADLTTPGGTAPTVQTKFVPIGSVRAFSSGCGSLKGSGCEPGQQLEFFLGQSSSSRPETLFTEICKRKELVFVVGRTDRMRLSPKLQTRYEANVGLAQSRAEGVKDAVLQFCNDRGADMPTLLTQVAGPRRTPEPAPRQMPDRQGYSEDRSVEISSFQSEVVKVEDPAILSRQKSRAAWWSFGSLVAVFLLAVLMALGTTKWSAALDLATGEARLQGERKSKPEAHHDA